MSSLGSSMFLKKITVKPFTIAVFCLLVVSLSVVFLLFRRGKPLYVAFRQVGIRSSNGVPEIGRAGDVVTLSFALDTSRRIDDDLFPVVMINGAEAPVRKSGDLFLASRILKHEDPEGPVSFSIELRGSDGATMGSICSTTDGSSIFVDTTPPSLEEVVVTTDNRINPAFVTAGTKVSVSIRSSEALGGNPDMRIAGVLPDLVEQLDATLFRAEAVLSEGLSAGPLPLQIEYKDRAGNSGPVFTGDKDSSVPALVYDPEPPEITSVGIASTNPAGRSLAVIGDMVILSFSLSEPPAAMPIVDIAGAGNVRITQLRRAEKPAYEAVAQMIEPAPTGRIRFSISVIDMAGNTRMLENQTTDGSSVYFRSVTGPSPALRTASAAPGLPFIGTSYERDGSRPQNGARVEGLGYIDALEPGSTMDLTIHFSLSIARTAPTGEDVAQESLPEKLPLRGETSPEAQLPVEPPPAEAPSAEPPPAVAPSVERTPADAATPTPEETLTAAPEETRREEAIAEPPDTEPEQVPASERADSEPEQIPAAKPADTEPDPNLKPDLEAGSEEEKTALRMKPAVQTESTAPEAEQADFAQLGSEAPVVIDSPQENSYFGSHVQVAGRVLNAENISSLSWEVSPLVFLGQQSEFLSGETDVDEYGVFSFIFPTEELSGSQQVVVTAKYDNGIEGKAKVALLEGDSDIPTFDVTPEGESALVSWEPNPLAATYSLEYRNISDDEEDATLDNVSSPSRITGLQIGNRYSFLLSAYAGDGGLIGSSSRREIVALAPDTLKPEVTAEYKRIRVRWPAITGAESYDLERSIDNESDFELVEEQITGTKYIDSDVAYGKRYHYRVSPAGESYFSSAASGEPLAVPEERTRVAVSWQDISVSDATVYGNYTFVAAEEDGLIIYDISNAAKPLNVSSIETSNARDVAVSDGYAYVADSDRGVRVVDIDNPGRPEEVGSRKTSDARGIELLRIDDETIHAVVADGTYGVKIVDVSNPKDPQRIHSIGTREANDLVVIEREGRSYAVVADGPGGVVIIDLDVAQPVVLSSFQTDNASGLAIAGNLLYLADAATGLMIFDLEDPANPELVSTYDVDGAVDVAVAEEYAYLASSTEGLMIFDVKSPSLPVFYDVAKIEGLRAVAVKGTKVFAGGEKGFNLLDAFTRGESYEIASVQTDGKAYEVSISDTADGNIYAYVADRAGGLKIFDVTAPDTLGSSSLLAHIETEYCREVLAAGDYAYIADGPGGLLIADLTPLWDGDPESKPAIIGTWNTDGNTRSLDYADGLVYLADGNRGVKIMDVSNPTRPTQVGSIRTEYAVNITVQNNTIFLADGDGGFRIYTADPENPTLLAAVDTANTRGVDVKDGIAYVVGSTGLSIIDVSAPAEPQVIGFYRTGYAEEVAVEGRLAFVAEGFNGLTIIDVIDPTSPYVVSRSENKYTVGVAVAGKYAFLVDTTGLKIVEVIIPAWAMRK